MYYSLSFPRGNRRRGRRREEEQQVGHDVGALEHVSADALDRADDRGSSERVGRVYVIKKLPTKVTNGSAKSKCFRDFWSWLRMKTTNPVIKGTVTIRPLIRSSAKGKISPSALGFAKHESTTARKPRCPMPFFIS